MKKSLALVTFILGLVTVAAGIATTVTSVVNIGLGKKYLD
jgi:hypothetical protein